MFLDEAVKNTPELQTPILVNAYFDESGKLKDPNSEIVCFGGFAGPFKQTFAFVNKWDKCIKDAGLASTSMKEAIHFNGPYHGWKTAEGGPAKRDHVLRTLAHILADSGLLIITAPMTSAEFNAKPDWERKKFWDDLEYCGFEACINAVLHHAASLMLHVTCDLSEQYAEKCITLYNLLRKSDPLVKSRCMALTFGDDTHHSGLQAADMIAYCSRAEHMTAEPKHPIIQEIIGILRSPDRQVASFVYDKDAELGGGKLKSDTIKA